MNASFPELVRVCLRSWIEGNGGRVRSKIDFYCGRPQSEWCGGLILAAQG